MAGAHRLDTQPRPERVLLWTCDQGLPTVCTPGPGSPV